MEIKFDVSFKKPWWAKPYFWLCYFLVAIGVSVDPATVADRIVRHSKVSLRPRRNQ